MTQLASCFTVVGTDLGRVGPPLVGVARYASDGSLAEASVLDTSRPYETSSWAVPSSKPDTSGGA